MTPEHLARLHAATFLHERPWQVAEFADLLASPLVTLYPHAHGFALTRRVADESELLTLAVDPDHQRQGIARHLLIQWLNDCASGVSIALLEVAADNIPARALYRDLGFEVIATRRGYYKRKGAKSMDAEIMRREISAELAGTGHVIPQTET